MSNPTSDLQTLWKLIRNIQFGMLIHHHRDGTSKVTQLLKMAKSAVIGERPQSMTSTRNVMSEPLVSRSL